MADTTKKVSELETASQVDSTDLVMLSQGSSQSGFASVKATILALAQKIVTGINFTSALETESKTIAGAINEAAQGGGTTVIANPTGTPTDELNSIQIGNDIYSLPEGGGEHLLNDILTAQDLTKVTASSNETSVNSKEWKAFDGEDGNVNGNSWLPARNDAPCWLQYKFSTAKYISEVKLHCFNNLSNQNYNAPAKIQASNDGTTWTDISESTDIQLTGTTPADITFACNRSQAWTYVRLYSETCLLVYGGASCFVGEMEIYGRDNASGGGGHTILDDSGTSLAQEDDLQFKGTYSHDDSTNGKTVVEITREMTQAQYDLLSADEKKGIIRITDDNYVCEATEASFDNTGTSFEGDNVQEVLEEVDSKIDELSANSVSLEQETILSLETVSITATSDCYVSLVSKNESSMVYLSFHGTPIVIALAGSATKWAREVIYIRKGMTFTITGDKPSGATGNFVGAYRIFPIS